MLLTAIKEHGYAGRRIKIGQNYEVRNEKDSLVLRTAGLAKPAKLKVETKSRAPIGHQNQERPTRVMETRDEVPEVSEETSEESTESTSPQDRPRKKRRYKRHDMVPE